MIFASLLFLFGFLPLFLAVYHALPWVGARNLFLTLASFLFYAWSIPKYVPLMLLSTVIDWFVALRIDGARGPRARKRWLVASMVSNLALLGWFKYANLGVDVLRDITGAPLADWQRIALPVGISFYTFQSMSYTIDVYRGEVKPVRSFLDLLCYVSMFPQLVAGPIVRYHDVQAQIRKRVHAVEPFARGVVYLLIGLAKKVLIADNAALLVDVTYVTANPGLLDGWLATLAFAIQIYFDFSGYSDMAIGLGLMVGFRFPSNFLSPYRSASITEFWRRWHVSLSTWLRDYLYVPLGGNRFGTARTYCNLAATMLLGGLWHGAAYNFVLWGAYQGGWLVIERLAGKRALWGFLPHPLRIVATMVVVLGGWVLFKATSLGAIGGIGKGMLGMNGLGALPIATGHSFEAWCAVVAGLAIAWTMPRTEALAARFTTRIVWWAIAVGLLALGQLASRQHSPFIYFQF
ncbi:MAG: MBOAT family protein [Planctomycetes bacterium]|nr:MBOAT family protein [Planctomycetota bacterium]